MRTTDDWIARHVPDTQEAIRQALEILDRYGYTAADLAEAFGRVRERLGEAAPEA